MLPNTSHASRQQLGEDARVRCEIAGPVATITLTRPDRRNAQTPLTWAAMCAIRLDLPREVRAERQAQIRRIRDLAGVKA